MNSKPIAGRFWSKVSKQGPIVRPELGPCWLWVGNVRGRNTGYGTIHLNGKMESAHRVAWLLETGAWPNPQALHKCDTTLCVRFSHLFEGTNQDNVDDKLQKHRGAPHNGENNPKAKLTEEKVKTILQSLVEGQTVAHLAATYGVTKEAIYAIKWRKNWKSVTL